MDAHIIAPIAVFIYGLIDPRDGHLRYVGRTKRRLPVRLNGHIQSARKAADRHVHSWIRGILLSGMKPEIILLEQSDADGWVEAEQFWIEYARSLGADLTNIAAGGLGALGFHHTMEQRQKWSRERRGENHYGFGKSRPPEVHAALNAGKLKYQQEHGHPMLGKKHSVETVAKIKENRALNPPKQTEAAQQSRRAAMEKRWADPAWRDRWTEIMSGPNNPLYGVPMTPEKRAQMIKSGPGNPRYGKKLTDETKARIGAAHKGKVVSEETRRKQSEAAKRRPKKVREDQGDAP